MIFGNVQSLAMEPLGRVAGLAAAIFGAVPTMVSLPLSWLVSGYFDNSIAPLVAGFAIAGAMSLALMRWARRAWRGPPTRPVTPRRSGFHRAVS